MKVNEVLSKEMRVVPLDERQTAKFRLINANKLTNKSTMDGRRIPVNPIVQIPDRDVVYDRFKKTNVLIGNVVSEDISEGEDGKVVKKLITENIIIQDGEIQINHLQNDTYSFLMRCNANASNPFRDHTKKAKFELVDEIAERNERISYALIEDDAIMLIRDSKADDVLKIAANLTDDLKRKVKMDSPIPEVRLALRSIAKKNPQAIIKASDYVQGKVKMQIIEAENWKLITRSDTTRSWYTSWNDERKLIHKVDINTDMIEGLLEWMNTKEGRTFYQKDFLVQIDFFKRD